MPNFFEAMRLRNMFGQPDLNSDQPPTPPDVTSNFGLGGMFNPTPPPDPNMFAGSYGNTPFMASPMGSQPVAAPPTAMPYDVGARMRELYHPESAASDRFSSLAGSYPTQPEASLKRRIGGGILGALTDLGTNLGGNRTGVTGKSVYDEVTGKNKFYEDVANWKNQIAPAQQAANLERYSNVNDRTLAYETVSKELAAQAEKDKQKTAEAKQANANARTDIYKYKAEHPGLKFSIAKGGNFVAEDPITGKITDTGISSGTMSDDDKAQLKQEFERENIGSRGAEAANVAGINVAGRKDVANAQIAGREALKRIPPPSGIQGEKPTQTRVRQFNAARQLYNTRPDLRPFIKIGNPGSQDFTIAQPGQSFWGGATGPNPEQAKAMQDAIYGEQAIGVTQPGRTGATGTPAPAPKVGTSPPTIPGVPSSVMNAPGAKQPLYKTQKNAATGETRTQVSNDGGVTWQTIPK